VLAVLTVWEEKAAHDVEAPTPMSTDALATASPMRDQGRVRRTR
jgi:hypothetical protein